MSDDRPTPIDAAIDAAERKQMEEELARLEPRSMFELPVLATPHAWSENHEITINAVPGEVPTMLVWDGAEGAWRGIFLPDDSRWRIVPDRAGLWVPPGGSS